MCKIILEDIELYAYHGHLPEERKIGALFRINLEIDATIMKACKSDLLEDTLDYQKAYDIVAEEMKKSSALLENIALRITERIMKASDLVKSVKIKVAKMNPPLGGNVKSVAVEIKQNRSL
jgi:dihydroneopterin aldolase